MFTPRRRPAAPAAILGCFALLAGPGPAPAAPPADPPAATEPSWARDTTRLLDLRALPRFQAERITSAHPTLVDYTARGTVAEALAYLRGELAARGWREVKGVVDTPDTDQYADHTFGKDGSRVRASVGATGTDGEVMISLIMLGNVDVSSLPKPPGATAPVEPTPSGANYQSTADVAGAAESCRKAMSAAGWREMESYNPLPNDNPQLVSVEYLKNASRVTLTVLSNPQVNGGKTYVGYLAAGVLPVDMPVADDATGLKVDAQKRLMEYRSAQEPAKVVASALAKYKALGWQDRTPKEARGDGAAMAIVDDGQGTRMVVLARPQKEGGTGVTLRPIAPEDAAVAASPPTPVPPTPPATRPKPPAEDAGAGAMKAEVDKLARSIAGTIKAETGVDINKELDEVMKPEPGPGPKPSAAIPADAVPLPPSARDVARDPARKRVTFTSADGPDAQKRFFEETLGALGWDRVSTVRSKSNERVTLDLGFSKDGRSLDVEVDHEGGAAPARTAISGDGLAFAGGAPAPPAEAGALEAEDEDGLPIPKDHEARSSESTLYRRAVEVRVAAPRDAVLAFYRKELAARGWKEAPGAKVAKDRAELSYTSADAALSVTLSGDDETTATLVRRKAAEAKKAGLLPLAGKAKLVMGNQFPADATVTINGSPYVVAKGIGVKDPASGLKLDLFPGKNQLVVKLPGRADQRETVAAAAGEAWGLLILDGGEVMVIPVY